MSCKPGVAGSIPGFAIEPLLVEPSGVPVIKYTKIINPPGLVLTTTLRKATKYFLTFVFGAQEPSHLINGNIYLD